MSTELLTLIAAATVTAALTHLGSVALRRLPEASPGPRRLLPEAEANSPGVILNEPESPVRRTGSGLNYADIAGARRLSWWLTGTGALIGGVLAEAASLDGALPAWCYLAAVGLLLSYVDARLRVLPKQIIGPSYVVVAVLLGFAAFQEGTPSPLVHAALGCALMATVYFVLWFIYPAGMGFGDVRLAGLLGMGLGYLGWAQVIVGLYAGFVLGGVGGLMLLMLQRLPDRHYAFGPFMVTGALLGAGAGGALVHWWYSFVMR